MVAAVRTPSVCKRFWSDVFAPPANYRADTVRSAEVTADEILAGGVRESDWSFPAILSTSTEDRVGDTVAPEGCHYDGFATSPCVFFDHQAIKFAVGTLRGPRDGRLYFAIEPGKGILGRIWIRQPNENDHSEHAEICRTIWQLVQDGLLNGISVGFDPVGPVKKLRSGGDHYDEWELLEVSLVHIPANRECIVLRDLDAYLDGLGTVGKRLHPTVLKSLTAMTKAHHGTRDIQFRNGKWVILDNKTRKVLSHHDTKEEAEAAMRALQFHKHEKSMSESSGTGGGYTVGNDVLCKAINERLSDHGDVGKGHEVYHHPETGELLHVHPDGAEPDHVKGIAEDLADVPGVKNVRSHAKGEPGLNTDGYVKVYPAGVHKMEDMGGASVHKMEDMGGDGGGDVTEGHRAEKRKHQRALRLAVLGARGQQVMTMLRKGVVNGFVHKSLEECVQRKIPKLIEEGYGPKQAQAIAFSMCGEQKGLLPPITKAFVAAVAKAYGQGDGDHDADDQGDTATPAASEDTALESDVTDEAAEERPDGVELAQGIIDMIESALPRLEPERREFWEKVMQEVSDHGEEIYPHEDFGGADTAGAEGAAGDGQGLTTSQEAQANEAQDQADNHAMLYRYKFRRPATARRVIAARRQKALRLPFGEDDAETIKKAANHCHEIGDMPTGERDGGMHLKGYTLAHHRKMRVIARALDRLHGKIDKHAAGRDEEDAEEARHAEGQENVQKSANAELLKRLDDRDRVLDELTYRATGRRLLTHDNGTPA